MTPRHALLPLALMLAWSSSALAERGFQVRDLATLDRYSSPTLSHDGRKLVFAKRVVDYAANKSATNGAASRICSKLSSSNKLRLSRR